MRRFGFEVCFFIVLGSDQLVQVAITDVDANTFHFDETYIPIKKQTVQSDSFNMTSGSAEAQTLVTAYGGNGKDVLHSMINGDDVLDLSLESLKLPVLHYEGLPHNYSFGGYTYYYSRVGMTASGTLTVKGKTYAVEGTGWFDRQYGDLAQAVTQVGYRGYGGKKSKGVHFSFF